MREERMFSLLSGIKSYFFPSLEEREAKLRRIGEDLWAMVDDYLTSVLTTMVMEYLGRREIPLRQWDPEVFQEVLVRKIACDRERVFLSDYPTRVMDRRGNFISYSEGKGAIHKVTDQHIYEVRESTVKICDLKGNYQQELATEMGHSLINIDVSPKSGSIVVNMGIKVADQLRIFNAKGQLIKRHEKLEGIDQESIVISGIAVSRQDLIYMADSINNHIYVYDFDGRLIRQWGKTGCGEGEFNHARDIAIGPHDEIFVSDSRNGRVQVFDLEGRYLRQWNRRNFLNLPSGNFGKMAISSNNEIFIQVGPRIEVFLTIPDIIPG
jgi:hypothetical protein